MEKEKVLEIEITKINYEWSVITITKLNETLENNDIFSWRGGEDTEFNFYERKIYINPFHPYQPFLILNQYIECAETIIDEINKKYGIPKRWRAAPHEKFFCIYANGEVSTTQDDYGSYKESFYELGNYFKTEEEAQKIIDSKEWQEFWERVRNGEIGGDE
jgi:hypothetical protein